MAPWTDPTAHVRKRRPSRRAPSATRAPSLQGFCHPIHAPHWRRAPRPACVAGLKVGRGLVDAGCRVVTGGLGGVMAAALRGAASSAAYRDGDTLALLPGADPCDANPYASVVIATGLGHHRNGVVAAADAVVAVGGGAGTLSEASLAWVWGRGPVVVLTGVAGLTAGLAGRDLGARGGGAAAGGGAGGAGEPAWRRRVLGAADAAEAVRAVVEALAATGQWRGLRAAPSAGAA
jgi:uncharacterized protein (TIGR00725 family)